MGDSNQWDLNNLFGDIEGKTGSKATQRIGSDMNRGIIGAKLGGFRRPYKIPQNLLRKKLVFD